MNACPTLEMLVAEGEASPAIAKHASSCERCRKRLSNLRIHGALESDLAVIGWDELSDLSNVSDRDEMLRLLVDTYSEEKPNTLRNWATQPCTRLEAVARGADLPTRRCAEKASAFGEAIVQ